MSEATPEQVASAHAHVLRGFALGELKLRHPWIFDGTRRVYEDGRPVYWVARAVDMSGLTGDSAPLQTGEGVTPLDAAVALVVNLDTLQGGNV